MDASEFKHRRKCLMDMMGNESIAILPTASVSIRNNDVTFPFRPDSDFYYLTGYPEPEAVAVLIPDRAEGEYVLFCRKNDPDDELWHGRRAGLAGAREIYGADEAFPIAKMQDVLPRLLEDKERVFYAMGKDAVFDQRVLGWIGRVRDKSRSGVHAPDKFISLHHLLHDMRLYKSRREIAVMRKAAKISAKAHKHMMQCCRPGLMEYQVEAELLYQFASRGARYPAYPCIVGGGDNGCILHYTENSGELQDGELLLVDAGAEYQGYASDITRTIPINGKFTRPQRAVYEVVLAAQLAAIKQIVPGNHWNDPHEAAVRMITDGLIDLGILKGSAKTVIKEHDYATYYMHRTGHWLGMDVHDVGDYKVDGEWRVLEPGMVMTVEPGLYFPPTAKNIANKWRGVGIRIEDDVLVTKTGCDVLSKDAPKTVDDIEALMAKGVTYAA